MASHTDPDHRSNSGMPAVTFASPQGFPVLSHTGECMLKDLVLAAAAIAAVAHDVQQHRALAEPAPHSS